MSPATAELARTLSATCATVVDVDELVAAIEATGVNDRVAQQRYGQPSVFALGEAVLAHLGQPTAPDPPPPRPAPYARQALLRCALYLTPVLLAVAAARPLSRVAWPAPAAALVLGWGGAQALAYLGHVTGAHRGPGPAARLLGAGFLALAATWSALLAVAPPALVGDRPLAYAVTLAELAFFAVVAAALVTRSELAVLYWTLPSWAVAGAAIAGWWPALALLPAGIAVALARAFRPVRAPADGPGVRIGPAEGARAVAYLLIGLGQAISFVLVWRAAPGGSTAPPAALPLLLAVPLIELFIGWHTARVAVGLDASDNRRAYHRHLRTTAALTVAALLVPLLGGAALGVLAYRLPFGLSTLPDARGLVLALSGGVLLGGVFAVVLLLATRGRLAAAALLAAAPTALTLAGGAERLPLTLFGLPSALVSPLLPATVVALTLVYVAGLAVAGYVLFDPRSYR